jgi:hypothetical protein
MDNKDRRLEYSDFLTNSDFIKWRLLRTEELDRYWSDFVKKNPHYENALQLAIDEFKAVRLNRKCLPQEAINELHERIIHDSQKAIRIRRLRYYWSVAACFVLLASSVLFTQFFNKTKAEAISETIIGEVLSSEDIQLISGHKTVKITQNADLELLLESKVSVLEEGEIISTKVDLSGQNNKLIVPYGKRSTLLLSDGSKVWLNSGTEIEFPADFKPDERRINILRGEIYLEVTENKESPFYVHTSDFDVCVYGTKFNVSCYRNAEKSVVLVDGKVGIQSDKNNTILNPGELFSVNGDKIEHQKVDVNEYISWKDGMFIFKKIKITDLLEKIGRYYNVEFKNSRSAFINRTCTGELYLSEDMEQVMNIICAISNTSYEMSGNTILITDKENKYK